MKQITAFFLLLCAFSLFAQRDSVKFTAKFRFADGVYFSYKDLKKNKPNAATKNLQGTVITKPKSYLTQITPTPKNGADSNKIAAAAVWAVVVDGVPYLRWQYDSLPHDAQTFVGLQLLGKICYATYTQEVDALVPMKVYDPESGKHVYTGMVRNKEKIAHRKIYNFNTGELLDLTADNLRRWAADDKKLIASMTDLTGGEQQQRLFKCLLIYNDRNFVYIRK